MRGSGREGKEQRQDMQETRVKEVDPGGSLSDKRTTNGRWLTYD